MIRILLRALVFLLSAALGLWVASLVLSDLTVTPSGFVTAVVVFAVTQSVLSPFLAKVVARGAPAFLGGIGLLSTFVALWIASLFPGGLTIEGWQTWILAALVVWLITALATLLLPLVFLREAKDKRGEAARPTP
ncbi:phage holin family protein [Cryobacterium sp. N22]|uniref:phage holin family protein n=1 Tax=Cryobacterium sp. N22 TaxID=2048290 RepID=UPI000CE55650|nr:phage holin family protein [Cryobacterium sp. N22]